MADSELDALREEVKRRRKAATNKISRMRRAKGVDIGGTDLDPRRDIKVIKRYNRTQLANYLKEINHFQSREVGFVAGVGGTPLPKSAWEHYKQIERQYNAVGAKHNDSVGDFFIPTAGMTIRQRDATLRADRLQAQGDTVNRPFSTLNRSPNNINGVNALNKLAKDLQKKLDRNFLPKEIKKARKQAKAMFNIIGGDEFAKSVDKLTDAQFDVVWNYTDLARKSSIIYAIIQGKAAGWQSSVIEDQSSDIGELLTWASTLPSNQTRKGKVK